MKNKFKTIGLLLCFAATLMMVSCNKDEVNTSKIVGTWGCISSYEHYWGTDVWGDGSLHPYDHESNDNAIGAFLDLKDDATYTITGPTGDIFYPTEGNWLVDGNSLILGGRKFEIQHLDNTSLKLYRSHSFIHIEGVGEYIETICEFKKQK